MTLLTLFDKPGVHRQLIEGPVGHLEVLIDVPMTTHRQYLAIIGHPHSLQGGTMDNKVVTSMAKVFHQLGIISIRFNFRGVGGSQGSYDEGLGEAEDMLHLLNLAEQPDLTVCFAGFSFGSYVAYRAISLYQHQSSHATALVSIAPAVHHYDYSQSLSDNTPWLVVQGLDDEVVPEALVREWAKTAQPSPDLEYFPDTGHFFHGKLLDLKSTLLHWIQKRLLAP